MLIISRKPQESFLIGDDIEVIVLEAQNDRVRLGIVAPKEIQILRKELHDTKAANGSAGIGRKAETGQFKKHGAE